MNIRRCLLKYTWNTCFTATVCARRMSSVRSSSRKPSTARSTPCFGRPFRSRGRIESSPATPHGRQHERTGGTPMLARILVPTDFSDPSEAALAYGRTLANQFDAALHLLHIAENPFLRATIADRRSIEDAPGRWLEERLTDDDRRRGAVTVVENSDEPAKEILQYAQSANIDL